MFLFSLVQGAPFNDLRVIPAGGDHLGFIIGMVVAIGCILGGFAAMGGRMSVIWQPWEFVIICGASLGTFIVANPLSTIRDTGRAMMDAICDRSPTQRHYLDVLGILYTLMRELRGKARSEVEDHVDNPTESTIFKSFPKILSDRDLTHFICEYCRLIIIGNARTHEIEALMDEEIQAISRVIVIQRSARRAMPAHLDGFIQPAERLRRSLRLHSEK
jgi:chemotaxis protein MotA